MNNLFKAIYDHHIVEALDILHNDRTIDLESKNFLGETALLFAVKRGEIAVLEKLIERGANPNCLDDDENCALHLARFPRNHGEILKILYRVCDPQLYTHKNNNGHTFYHCMVNRYLEPEVLNYTISHTHNLDILESYLQDTQGAIERFKNQISEPILIGIATLIEQKIETIKEKNNLSKALPQTHSLVKIHKL